MDYSIYKLRFKGSVHFGNGSLSSSNNTFMADTLFSSLCVEAIKRDSKKLEELYGYVNDGKLLFSDAFPYNESDLFLPKPLLLNKVCNSKDKKKLKKLEYIPVRYFDEYLLNQGNYYDEIMSSYSKIGKYESREMVQVKNDDNAEPYYIGTYRFFSRSGLYLIVGCESIEAKECFDNLFRSLSYTGIGGKRSIGMGVFDYSVEHIDQILELMLSRKRDYYMSLSVSMPKESDRELVFDDAIYSLIRRSGFVFSDTYASNESRKKDFYSFAAGSCFKKTFDGDIYDVSDYGSHPVYQYAKPLLIGV